MKIQIDGHGGHMCEAWLEGSNKFAIGGTIDEAIGRLIRQNLEICGIELEILPCDTTAYDRVDSR